MAQRLGLAQRISLLDFQTSLFKSTIEGHCLTGPRNVSAPWLLFIAPHIEDHLNLPNSIILTVIDMGHSLSLVPFLLSFLNYTS